MSERPMQRLPVARAAFIRFDCSARIAHYAMSWMESGSRAARPRKTTIAAVAVAARTSVSTVSRVANGGHASAELRARVQQVMKNLNYRPSIAARSLRAGCTGRIGVVCASNQPDSFLQVLAGIEARLAPTGQSAYLASLMVDGHYSSGVVAEWIRLQRVDGLILFGYTARECALVSGAHDAGLPVVLIAPDVAAPGCGAIQCDDVGAGRLVAQHLLAHRHGRIAFFGGPRESLVTRERLQGLGEILGQVRLWPPADDVSHSDDSTYAAGATCANDFLTRSSWQRPTAVVLGSDMMAIGFMRTILRHGLKVPDDVSVVGFDGIPLGESYWPGLTTVAQPAQEMGASACSTLLEHLDGTRTTLSNGLPHPVRLICRESTGPSRVAVSTVLGKAR